MVFGMCEGTTDGCRRLMPSWSRFSMVTRWSMVGSPCPTDHCAQLCLLPIKFVQVVLFMQLFRFLEYASFSFGIPPHRCELL
jgi:hypothetical protein